MIVHFLEVWVLVIVTFAIGCAIGAAMYGAIADSHYALAQGAVADRVGDVLDRLKATVGLGAEWRTSRLKPTVRAAPQATPQLPPPSRPSEALRLERGDHVSARALPRPAQRRIPAVRPAVPSVVEDETVEAYDAAEFTDSGDPERVASAEAVADDGIVPRRPPGLPDARSGIPDSLTRIRGIGKRNEAVLNELGIFHFSQIAAWTPAEVRWIGQYLAFPERVEHDDWVGQAAVLASGGDTGFEKAADRRRRLRQQRFESRADNVTFDDDDWS